MVKFKRSRLKKKRVTFHVGKSGNEWDMGMNGPLTIYEKVLA